MVTLEQRNLVFEKITNDKRYKCKPGYKSPKQRFEEFDALSFREEDYQGQDSSVYDPEDYNSPTGELQKQQESLQDDVNYTDEDKALIEGYQSDFFEQMNSYLYGKGEYEDNDKIYLTVDGEDVPLSLKEGCEKLSEVIHKSPSLQENTVLWRGGEFPSDIGVGEHGVFKGFTSTSFNENMGKAWQENYGNYLIKIYAPKGTKGIVPTENLNCVEGQSELVLDKSQKYVVIAREDNGSPPIVEVLLY